ncbi:polysaccharide biosynthesis/export family protein [Pedobacter sp. MC2016-05]|uniref:polysaccharide biosynthesis/export family protein n=1 Tax=Pedobacter sp. MC2016-05 TaxID=2994474 RepID=UPI0022473285|nr:polysaccharide biosynthesis/export family protein [Pedobacter sp. MC2016-05]MCX2473224.1 polysaccharide biosynthesis/export family protein [Pedobacter sp. MC2016-05]
MNKSLSFCLKSFLLFYIVAAFLGCSGVKNIAYFQNLGTVDSLNNISLASFKEPTIQADDILAISVFTIDPLTGMQINQLATQSVQDLSGSNAVNGFLVDKNGEIELSIIGKVKLLGLTTFKARDLIREKASVDYKNANVQVRFANFKVNVIGEVVKPAIYIIPNEKVTVLDAIGLAGDLTLYGKRENVLVIREKDGKKEYARLNLYDTNIFSSPYYYLKQNDIVYVEPHKSKTAALNAPTRTSIGLILSAVSVLVLAITRL